MSKNYVTCLSNEIIESKAYNSLSGKAPQVFMHFLKARRMNKKTHCCTNSKELTFTYAQAEKMGISQHKFRKALDELFAKGFLEVVIYGGGTEKKKTEYGLSEKWRDYDKDGFKPFQKIKHNRGFCSEEHRFTKERNGKLYDER